MRPSLIAAFLLPLAAAAAGAAAAPDDAGIPPDGRGPERRYDARDFTRVTLAGSDSVDVRVGGGFAVRAAGDPRVLDRLRIVREGDTLVIGRRPGSWIDGARGAARLLVTMPAIAGAGVTGSGNLTIDRVQGRAFRGAVAGSGDLRLPRVAVDDLSLAIAGSGDVAATGVARALSARLAGSGRLVAPQLVARTATVALTGSGDVQANVRGAATVRLTGSGDVDLGPAARCDTRRTGSGTVRCGG
jgi:hypothetical protein